MPRVLKRILNVAFALALIAATFLYWLRDEFDQDSRYHINGRTIILHCNYSVVIRDASDQLKTISVLQRIDVGSIQFLCIAYVLTWTAWRMIQLIQQRQKTARGFEVIT